MRAVIQRVSSAYVKVDQKTIGEIGPGLLVLLGVGEGDQRADAVYIGEKIINLRIFEDEAGKMNRSVLENKGAVMVVSQFTLYGDCRKGRRPSFISAASPETGEELYLFLVEEIRKHGLRVATGEFGAHMEVGLVNDGPVTILLDSKRQF
jgi:D-tyrosyl-tRNA(Tyr) deacylase